MLEDRLGQLDVLRVTVVRALEDLEELIEVLDEEESWTAR